MSDYFNFQPSCISKIYINQEIKEPLSQLSTQLCPQKIEMLQTHESDDFLKSLKSRSLNTLANSYESSFENNFMYEHQRAFESKLTEFINFVNSFSQNSGKIFELQNKLINENQMNSDYDNINECIDSVDCKIEKNEKNQFKVDLSFQRKFKDFLDWLSKYCSSLFVCELATAANYLWINYLKIANEKPTKSELIEWADNLVKSNIEDYKHFFVKTKFACQSKESGNFSSFDEGMKDFIKFFFKTLALIIEQYFENPFFVEMEKEKVVTKRFSSFDDLYSQDDFFAFEFEQQEIFSMCKKKRKTSI